MNEDLLLAMGMPISARYAELMGISHPVFGYVPKPATLRGMAGNGMQMSVVGLLTLYVLARISRL